MATTTSPNMSLIIPGVGTELGPNWANEINADLSILDGHSHVPGSGVPITTQALNINADLTINNNNLTTMRSVRFSPQPGTLSGPADLGCLYESLVDLYYNDGSGNVIRLTQNGSITGAPGNITGLVSPASVVYSALDQTFVFQSGVNVPASLDAGSVTIRNILINSKGITLSAPASLSSNYTLTLPTIPTVQSFVTLDTGGNLAAVWSPDQVYITVSSNLLTLTPTAQQSLVPSGSIMPFGGTIASTGWMFCYGQSVLRSVYPTLFNAIGTAYGAADSLHFNLPNLQGMFLRGVSNTSGNDPDASTRTYQAPGGNYGNNVGSQQGFAMQQHYHNFYLSYNVQGGNNVGGTVPQSQGYENTSGILGATESSYETRPINVYVNYIIKT